MLSALIPSAHSYPAMPLAEQLVHQRCVHPGRGSRFVKFFYKSNFVIDFDYISLILYSFSSMKFTAPNYSNYDFRSVPINQLHYFLNEAKPVLYKLLRKGVEMVKPSLKVMNDLKQCSISEIFKFVREEQKKTLPTVGTFALQTMVFHSTNVVKEEKGLNFTMSDMQNFFLDTTYGFPSPTMEQTQKIFVAKQLLIKPVHPIAIKIACIVADTTKVSKSEWTAKTYEPSFCNLADKYREFAIEVQLLMSEHFSFETRGLDKKGTDLVDYLIPVIHSALVTDPNDFALFKDDLLRIVHYNDILNFKVTYKSKLGDFEYGTPKYAASYLAKCRATRGGDKADSSVFNYAYYTQYTLPRSSVKAIVFAKDVFNLSVHTGLRGVRLVGKNCKHSLGQLIIAGLKLDFVIVEEGLTNLWMPYIEKRNEKEILIPNCYGHAGVGFRVYTSATDIDPSLYFTIHCSDAEAYKRVNKKLPDNYFITTVYCDDIAWDKFVPSVAPHNMSGFYCETNSYNKFKLTTWLKMVLYSNTARTFSTYLPGRFEDYLRRTFKADDEYNDLILKFFIIPPQLVMASNTATQKTGTLAEDYIPDFDNIYEYFNDIDPSKYADANDLNRHNTKKQEDEDEEEVDPDQEEEDDVEEDEKKGKKKGKTQKKEDNGTGFDDMSNYV